MNETARVAVVTGGNRGLGLETCRQLAQRGYRVILGSRDAARGEAAAADLRGQGLDVTFHPLDVTDSASINKLVEVIEKDYGRLDVLVNNAGVMRDPTIAAGEVSVFTANPDAVRYIFETNTLGPLRVSQALIPLMKDEGCVVNVSSGMGQLTDMSGGHTGYRLSKTALNALTRIFADEVKDTRVKVNSVCPGWVRTDMGGPNAARSVEQGVETIVWLATLPEDGPSGGFFRDKQPIDW